jgi:hypothetical protein
MNWPSVQDVQVVQPKKRKKPQRPDLVAEVSEARRQREECAERTRPPPSRREKLKAQIMDMIRTQEFSNWYEATTGCKVERFIEEIEAIRPNRFFGGWFTQARRRILQIKLRNPWSDPEQKALWAEQIRNLGCKERRRAIHRLATPPWVDMAEIAAVYAERDRMTAATGIEHEVDHIVPLVNRHVCGLHVRANLRVIPRSENRRKSNKFHQ